MKKTNYISFLALGLIFGTLSVSSAGAVELIKNGDFSQLNLNQSSEFGSLYSTQQVHDWTTSGYNFVFLPRTAVTPGAISSYGNLQLWGPGNGSSNGFDATSPTDGNFIGADGAFQVAPIKQTLTGLTTGHKIDVSFSWAGAQQYGYDGVTTEQWSVSLGGTTQSTSVVTTASHGFSGWMSQTFEFVRTGPTQVLSFLAYGTPNGQPPFALLANVSAQDVTPAPEPLPGLAGTPLGLLALLGSSGKLRCKFAERLKRMLPA